MRWYRKGLTTVTDSSLDFVHFYGVELSLKWILTWWRFVTRSEWRRSAGFDKVAAVYNADRAQYGIFQSSHRKCASRLGG